MYAGFHLLWLRLEGDEDDGVRLLHDSGREQSDDEQKAGTEFHLRTESRARDENWNDLDNRLQ